MTRNGRRGITILDGVETAVAAARVAVSSATRSAFRHGCVPYPRVEEVPVVITSACIGEDRYVPDSHHKSGLGPVGACRHIGDVLGSMRRRGGAHRDDCRARSYSNGHSDSDPHCHAYTHTDTRSHCDVHRYG